MNPWYLGLSFFIGGVCIKEMIHYRTGPFILLRRAGMYGHASYLMLRRCIAASRREIKYHWGYCLSVAERTN